MSVHPRSLGGSPLSPAPLDAPAVPRMAQLPVEVTDASWARCMSCNTVREVSKFRPDGRLHCAVCQATRQHKKESPFTWELHATWFAKLLLSADVVMRLGDLGQQEKSGQDIAFQVSCVALDRPTVPWGDATPMRLEVSMSEHLTPWGLPAALRRAWLFLADVDSWVPSRWMGNPEAKRYTLPANPGEIDPERCVTPEYLFDLFMVK